uniref:Uncharacterized protein n=1 Tax=Brassica oleracea var. oleracea TaxID=109376 RepID=A0A0D3D6D4_BRAOL
MFLSTSHVPQTGVPASVTQPSNSVIHGFTPVGRANHYISSLKPYSIVKVDRFEVARIRQFDNLQVIANTNLKLSDVVGQIHSVQGSDLTKETTRVVIRLLIDP